MDTRNAAGPFLSLHSSISLPLVLPARYRWSLRVLCAHHHRTHGDRTLGPSLS